MFEMNMQIHIDSNSRLKLNPENSVENIKTLKIKCNDTKKII